MRVLWEKEELRLTEVGERLFFDSSTLTPLLKHKEQADLLSRTRATSDGRQVIIALTAYGDALRHKAAKLPEAVISASSCSVDKVIGMKSRLNELRASRKEYMSAATSCLQIK